MITKTTKSLMILIFSGIAAIIFAGSTLAEEREAFTLDLTSNDYGLSLAYTTETVKPAPSIANKDTKSEVFLVKAGENQFEGAQMDYQPVAEKPLQTRVISDTKGKTVDKAYSMNQYTGAQVY